MTRRELAQAMREGIKQPDVTEDLSSFVGVTGDGRCFVCALGAALVSHYEGDYNQADREFSRLFDLDNSSHPGELVMANLLGISESLARQISAKHWSGQSIESIAQWLESDPDWAEGWEEAR